MPEFEFQSIDLHRLRKLMYAARLRSLSGYAGSHRTRRGGEGLEFLDYRPYAPGDDFRKIDWALYGRLKELFVRVTESEECLFATLLVDVSSSMDSEQACSKVQLACQLATAFSYVLLGIGDRVRVGTYSDHLDTLIGPLQGISSIKQVMAYLKSSVSGGKTSLVNATTDLLKHSRRKGMVIIISDFLGNREYEEAVQMLVARREKVLLVQTLSPADWGGSLRGQYRLCDSETGAEMEVEITPSVRNTMRNRLVNYCAKIESFCRHRNQAYLQANTTDNYLEVICQARREKVFQP